jgi:hypothetical protein
LKQKTYYTLKIKKAIQLLFFKRHRESGVKGWELRQKLGSDYLKVLDLLDNHLEKLGLTVKRVVDEEINPEKATVKHLNNAKFYVTLKENQASKEQKLLGWRIDDLAGLAVSLGFIISNEGKAPKNNLEDLLHLKLPEWRVNYNLNRYLKLGYLTEDEDNNLYLGWRTRAEVDQKKLTDLFLEAEE